MRTLYNTDQSRQPLPGATPTVLDRRPDRLTRPPRNEPGVTFRRFLKSVVIVLDRGDIDSWDVIADRIREKQPHVGSSRAAMAQLEELHALQQPEAQQ